MDEELARKNRDKAIEILRKSYDHDLDKANADYRDARKTKPEAAKAAYDSDLAAAHARFRSTRDQIEATYDEAVKAKETGS